MKRFCTLLLVGTLGAGQAALATPSMSLNQFTPRVLPVLVQVDRTGKVTDVSPSVKLSPRYDRLLRQTLDEMITQPANDHGHAVASQFVINLGLQASPRPDGKYDAHFTYVSTAPVPAGSWYWEHIDGHRLALRSRNGLTPRYRNFDREHYRNWNDRPTRFDPPEQRAMREPVLRPAGSRKHP
jgi:hypothetical protein